MLASLGQRTGLYKLPYHHVSNSSRVIMPMTIASPPLFSNSMSSHGTLIIAPQDTLNTLKTRDISRPRPLFRADLSFQKVQGIIVEPISLVPVRFALGCVRGQVNRWFARQSPGLEIWVDKLRAPGCAVAGHEEADKGFIGAVVGGLGECDVGVCVGGGEGEAAVVKGQEFVFVAEEAEDVEDAALVDEGGVACYEEVESDEEGKQGFSFGRCGC